MNLRTTAISVAIIVSVCRASADAPEGASLFEPFEMDELRTTWRNLANESVMFPLDMKEMPVKIGKVRQLFLDNYLIAESQHLTRQVHRPKRYEGNPIVTPDGPREAMNRVVVAHVMQFTAAPRFRMWYWSYPGWHKRENDQQIRHGSSYAVSDDGMTWRKPDLDLHKIEGSELRNIVIPYGQMHGIFDEPDESDPQKRFKALVLVEARRIRDGRLTREYTIPEGYYLHTSPDGIQWKGDLSRRIIPSLYRGYHISQNGIGDTTRFWWDPLQKKYIGDVKFVLPDMRSRGIMESDDLIHWSRPVPTFAARDDHNEIYGHRGFVYQGMYVGMRWVYVRGRTKAHSSNVELDCSRDGSHWTRVAAGQPFMDFNPNHDTWDGSKMKPVAMLEVGDEIWIYYNGMPTELELNNPEFPDTLHTKTSAGLAKLRRDRFVSINAGGKAGTLVTRPLTFRGKKLHVNCEVAGAGRLTVGVVTGGGQPIEGYTIESCRPLTGDGIDIPVAWHENTDLPNLAGSPLKLRFDLQNAKLYSFWIE